MIFRGWWLGKYFENQRFFLVRYLYGGFFRFNKKCWVNWAVWKTWKSFDFLRFCRRCFLIACKKLCYRNFRSHRTWQIGIFWAYERTSHVIRSWESSRVQIGQRLDFITFVRFWRNRLKSWYLMTTALRFSWNFQPWRLVFSSYRIWP